LQSSLRAARSECDQLKRAAAAETEQRRKLEAELDEVESARVANEAECARLEVGADIAQREVRETREEIRKVKERLARSKQKQNVLKLVCF
jgi:chromosome segregation ATPase